MHVLLTNDDGPLDDHLAPYIKYLVDAIRTTTDWDLLIVVPDQQRLWIGKAHFAGKTVAALYVYTTETVSLGATAVNTKLGPFTTPQPQYRDDPRYQEWCLIDLTPAACADIGIHHLYSQLKLKPVDLVISGPNYGKNLGNLYVLTLGTVGAAMEAVTHGVKAVALSYAFFLPHHDHQVLQQAARISVALIRRLYRQLLKRDDVDIFLVNVPLLPLLEYGKTNIHYAPILENYWNSIYAPVATDDGTHRFQWQPDFKKVHKDSMLDPHHSDLRVLLDEGILVTPLKAAFRPVEPLAGQITLDDDDDDGDDAVAAPMRQLAIIDDTDKLSLPTLLITFPPSLYTFEPAARGFHGFTVTTNRAVLEDANVKVFHYGDYEDLDFDRVYSDNYYFCSYVYRKALIRKHYLANTVHHYVTKHPESILARAVPALYLIEVDYAEFLDDALDDAYELRDDILAGDRLWILKPSMSDKAQGIRVFRTLDDLQAIFDSFEADDDSDDDDGDDDAADVDNNGVIVSQLRHFIVQEYMDRPLLLANYGNRKFHLRVYVVAAGNLAVYVYRSMLALFAGAAYQRPQELADMACHLTNTCVQQGQLPLVVPFWQLHDPNHLNRPQKQRVFDQICTITGELFAAATSVDKMNFQPMPHALEMFGVDFLVNHDYLVLLLEVNLYPDFKQTGDELKGIIDELFVNVGDVAYEMMMGKPVSGDVPSHPQLVEVLRQN